MKATAMPPTPDTRQALLRDPNFRWLLSGAIITNLGDQFTLIALPWLVLQLTHDTRALGLVLALIAVPRAIFILIGGAVVDKHAPKLVLMITKFINTILLAVLAVSVLRAQAELWMIEALALGLGLSTAFSIPSGMSILPQVVQPAQLPAANGMMMGLRQVALFLGPLLAGALMAGAADTRGLAWAFALDAFSFALSAWTLAQVRTRPRAGAQTSQAVLAAVLAGLRHCWHDRQLRTYFLYFGGVAVLAVGPLQIAVPVLVNNAGMGAGALGLLSGSHGAGILLGMAASSVWPGRRLRSLGLTMLTCDAAIGLLIMPMGLISAAWQGALLMLLIGALGGYIQVGIITWMQQRVPPALMGRTMSLFMFIYMGLMPTASAATGWFMRFVSLPQLFMICGATMLGMCALAAAMGLVAGLQDGAQAFTTPAAVPPVPSSPLQPPRQSSSP